MVGRRQQRRLDLPIGGALRRNRPQSDERPRNGGRSGGGKICRPVSKRFLPRTATPARKTGVGAFGGRQHGLGAEAEPARGGHAPDPIPRAGRLPRARGAGVHCRRLDAGRPQTTARIFPEPIFCRCGNNGGTFRRFARSLGKHGGNRQTLQPEHYTGSKLPAFIPNAGRPVAR